MRYAKGLALAVVFLVVAMASSSPADAGVSFGFFSSNLSPHGSWYVSAQFGRVWQPRVYNAGWNPYYDGHWAYTDVGYSWVSDYPWGGIPYHYGTWVVDPVYGWVWVPGYTWAPSWVTFRTGPDFIGWAPVAPGFSIGVSFGAPVINNFIFVSSHNFFAPHIRSCAYPYSRAYSRGWADVSRSTVVNNIRVENNVVVNRGPDSGWMQRATGRQLRPENIERVNNSGWSGRARRDQIQLSPEASRGGVRATGWARSSETGRSAETGRPVSMDSRRGQGRASVAESQLAHGRVVSDGSRGGGNDRGGYAGLAHGRVVGGDTARGNDRFAQRDRAAAGYGGGRSAAPSAAPRTRGDARRSAPEMTAPRAHGSAMPGMRSMPRTAQRSPMTMQRGSQRQGGGAPQISRGGSAQGGGNRQAVGRSAKAQGGGGGRRHQH